MKLTISILFGIILTAQAQLIQSFEGGDNLNVGPGTAGYSFTVGAEPVTVFSLGVWASSDDGTLSTSHAVGIWSDAVGHPVIVRTVVSDSTSFALDGFWYQKLATPITLAANTTYYIAAQYADVDFDQARGNALSVTTDARVTLGDARLSTGTAFNFPDLDVPGANLGFIGPNALFTPIPEPASMGVVALALLLAAVLKWRHA